MTAAAEGPGGRARPAGYLPLLEELDAWQANARSAHPGVMPCRRGCSACCHGPFDVSIADVGLLTEGFRSLTPDRRAAVLARARAQLEQVRALDPDWASPYDIAAIGEARFDRLTDRLAEEPCPLLDADEGCSIYHHRPMVCRLMGLPLVTESGDVIENGCPIQDDYPAYRELAPIPFALERFEADEARFQETAAERLVGHRDGAGYETIIAAALVVFGGVVPAGAEGPGQDTLKA